MRPQLIKTKLKEYTFNRWTEGEYRYKLKGYKNKYGEESQYYQMLKNYGDVIISLFNRLSSIKSNIRYRNIYHGIVFIINLWKSIPSTKEKDLDELARYIDMNINCLIGYMI